jgi:hypothetical protein
MLPSHFVCELGSAALRLRSQEWLEDKRMRDKAAEHDDEMYAKFLAEKKRKESKNGEHNVSDHPVVRFGCVIDYIFQTKRNETFLYSYNTFICFLGNKMKRSRGSAHKNMKYNQWTEAALTSALVERKQLGTGFGTLEKKYGVPKATIWKRAKGIVPGTKHASGGKRIPRVLNQGRNRFV